RAGGGGGPVHRRHPGPGARTSEAKDFTAWKEASDEQPIPRGHHPGAVPGGGAVLRVAPDVVVDRPPADPRRGPRPRAWRPAGLERRDRRADAGAAPGGGGAPRVPGGPPAERP